MGKPQLELVKNGPRDPSFREKTWNVFINATACLVAVATLFIDIFLILPIGIMCGLVINRFPEWAMLPLTLNLLVRIPGSEIDNNRKERFSSRPFYRKREE